MEGDSSPCSNGASRRRARQRLVLSTGRHPSPRLFFALELQQAVPLLLLDGRGDGRHCPSSRMGAVLSDGTTMHRERGTAGAPPAICRRSCGPQQTPTPVRSKHGPATPRPGPCRASLSAARVQTAGHGWLSRLRTRSGRRQLPGGEKALRLAAGATGPARPGIARRSGVTPGQHPKRDVPEKFVPKTRDFRSRARTGAGPDLGWS